LLACYTKELGIEQKAYYILDTAAIPARLSLLEGSRLGDSKQNAPNRCERFEAHTRAGFGSLPISKTGNSLRVWTPENFAIDLDLR